MTIYTVFIGATLLSTAGLCALILKNRGRNIHSYLYIVLSICVMLWALTSYLVDAGWSEAVKVACAHVTYLFGYLVMCSILVFSRYFPVQRPSSRRLWVLYVLLAALGIVFAVPPFVVRTAYGHPNAASSIVTGPLYGLFSVVVVAIFALIMVNLGRQLRKHRDNVRSQVSYVMVGIALGFIWIVASTVLIPAITGNWQISLLGPVGVLFLTSSVAYAMLRFSLFDIRAAVARGSAYIISLLVLTSAYIGLLTLMAGLFGIDSGEDIKVRFTYILVAVVTAMTFAPIRKFFDHLTERIFYRHQYNSELLIDDFSSRVVKIYEIDDLLASSTAVLQQYFLPEHVAFVIRTATGEFTVRATTHHIPTTQEISQLSQQLSKSTEPITRVADLPDSLHQAKVLLMRYRAHLLVRLMVGDEQVGYLVLGERKNGEEYTERDVLVLGVISDELALAIQNALRFQQIEGFNEKLIKEVDSATHELKRSNQKLQALDEAKDEFISMASHQLRTPLTSIKGYLSMVLEGDVGEVPEQQKEMLTTAFTSAQRMVYLISDLLNVSRLQTGKFVIEPVETYLPDIIEQELAQLKESVAAKKITLAYDKPHDFPVLMLDETKIRQVIMNFVDNALYYTPAGGTITVSLLRTPRSVEFTVVDNGIGVPKNEVHKLFTKFYRAGNARMARPDGTGLGLFMAKKVIIASGGAIIFKSKENHGSTFGFTFPYQK